MEKIGDMKRGREKERKKGTCIDMDMERGIDAGRQTDADRHIHEERQSGRWEEGKRDMFRWLMMKSDEHACMQTYMDGWRDGYEDVWIWMCMERNAYLIHQLWLRARR